MSAPRQVERNPSGNHAHIASGYATWSTSTSSASVVVQAGQRGANAGAAMENGTANGAPMNGGGGGGLPRKREPWKRHRPTNSNGSIGPQNLPKPTSVPNVRIISESPMTNPDSPTFIESPASRPTPNIYSIETADQSHSDNANVIYSHIPSDNGDTKTSYTNPAYTDHVGRSSHIKATESPTDNTSAYNNTNNSSSNLNHSALDNMSSGQSESPSRVKVTDLPPPGGIDRNLTPGDSASPPGQPEVSTIQSGPSSDDLVELQREKSTENLVTHL